MRSAAGRSSTTMACMMSRAGAELLEFLLLPAECIIEVQFYMNAELERFYIHTYASIVM